MGLTCALRTWDAGTLGRHAAALESAARAAGSDRDPAVREEGRRMYWAMRACGGAAGELAEGMYDGRSREMKTLVRERDGIDAEWEDGGRMAVLAETGVPGDEPREKPAQARKPSGPARVSVFRQKGNGNAGRRGPGSRLREMGAPFKGARASTAPARAAAGAGAATADPPSAARGDEGAAVDEKENAAAAAGTPAKSVGFRIFRRDGAASTPPAPSPGASSPAPAGTPLVNLLARAPPLSPERIARDSADPVGEIVTRLSGRDGPGEQRLAVKALALYARENGRDLSPSSPSGGGGGYSRVMGCLLDQIAAVRDADDGPAGPGASAGPSRKGMSPRHQMQHIFLQGVRSLVQFVPARLEVGEVRRIVDSLMECTRDAPFEIVHTAERALQNLSSSNPEASFGCLLPYARADGLDLNDAANPPALLSALRTLRCLVDRVSGDALGAALPSLMSLFRGTVCHRSVDVRKATVFVLVELHFVLGDGLDLDGLSDCHRRLVDMYVDRHPKRVRQ